MRTVVSSTYTNYSDPVSVTWRSRIIPVALRNGPRRFERIMTLPPAERDRILELATKQRYRAAVAEQVGILEKMARDDRRRRKARYRRGQ